MTSTRRPWAAATRPAAAAIPAPNSTWDGARRTANSVIGVSRKVVDQVG